MADNNELENSQDMTQPPQKKRRIHARKACVHCRKAHAGCDSTRPCYRCRQKGLNCFEGEEHLQAMPSTAPSPAFVYNSQQHIMTPIPSPQQQPLQHHHQHHPFPSLFSAPAPLVSTSPPTTNFLSDSMLHEYEISNDVMLHPVMNQAYAPQQQQQPLDANQHLMLKLQKLESLITQQSERINGFITNYTMMPSAAAQWTNHLFHPQSFSPPMPTKDTHHLPIPFAQQALPSISSKQHSTSPPLQTSPPNFTTMKSNNSTTTSPISLVQNPSSQHATTMTQQPSTTSPTQQQQASPSSQQQQASPSSFPDQHPSHSTWKILLNISHTMITIRDKNSLKLLSYNGAFLEWLTTKSSSLERMQERFGDGVQWLTKTVEPLFMVLLLNVIQDEAKLIHSMEMKTLWVLGKQQVPVIIKTTFHVEDDFLWSEHSPVPNNQFDNAFKFNEDMIYPATVKVVIPENATVEQAKALYENESKARYMTMLEVLMNKRKK